jgi:hypothetical protein
MQKIAAVVAFTVAFALAGDARAQIDPAKLDSAKKAAAQLKSMAAGSEKSGKPPRDSDPAVSQLLTSIFDVRDLEAAKTIPVSAMQPLSERMLAGTQVAIVYMLAGTGFTDLGQAANAPGIGDRINVNTVEFAPEFGRYFDFQLKIQSAVIDAVLTKMATSNADELKRIEPGIAEVRSGSQRVASGFLETLALNGLSDAWLRDRTPAMTAVAPKLAKFLLPEQKAQLRELALQVAAVTDEPQTKKAVEDFAARLGS